MGSVSSLQGLDGPVAIEIMNRQFVVWHKNTDKEKKNSKANQQWAVQLDECPHRLAPLSQGRVDQEDGCIEW